MTQRASAGGISATVDKPRRILAVDYGRKRIGLALSDELGLTAQPLATLVRVNRQTRSSAVARGLPYTRRHAYHRRPPAAHDGRGGRDGERSGAVCSALEKEIGIGVELVDERLTSWEAEQTIAETKSSARRRGKPVDDVAAAILLRDYLERTRGQAPSAAAEKDLSGMRRLGFLALLLIAVWAAEPPGLNRKSAVPTGDIGPKKFSSIFRTEPRAGEWRKFFGATT